MPARVQRRRTAGWSAPLDALGRKPVYVGRGTRWGNPWVVARTRSGWVVEEREPGHEWMPCSSPCSSPEEAARKRAGVLKRYPDLETRIVRKTTTWTLEADA